MRSVKKAYSAWKVATLVVATSLPAEAERQTHLTLGSLFKSKDKVLRIKIKEVSETLHFMTVESLWSKQKENVLGWTKT